MEFWKNVFDRGVDTASCKNQIVVVTLRGQKANITFNPSD